MKFYSFTKYYNDIGVLRGFKQLGNNNLNVAGNWIRVFQYIGNHNTWNDINHLMYLNYGYQYWSITNIKVGTTNPDSYSRLIADTLFSTSFISDKSSMKIGFKVTEQEDYIVIDVCVKLLTQLQTGSSVCILGRSSDISAPSVESRCKYILAYTEYTDLDMIKIFDADNNIVAV